MMLLSFVAIVLFVVVVDVVDTMFFIYSMHRRLLPPLVVLPVVCVVFYENTAFNSDISAWNTGAVTTMYYSKSFID